MCFNMTIRVQCDVDQGLSMQMSRKPLAEIEEHLDRMERYLHEHEGTDGEAADLPFHFQAVLHHVEQAVWRVLEETRRDVLDVTARRLLSLSVDNVIWEHEPDP